LSLDPQKTIIAGQNYEWFPAEVLNVDFSGKDKEKLYTLYCRIMGAFGSQTSFDVIQARALDANIKNIPIIGEIVLVTKAPTPYNSAAGTAQEYYYSNPVSVQSSVHHNGLPGVTDMSPDRSPKVQPVRKDAQDGITNKVKQRLLVNKTIDPNFAERLDVYPIQPYSGDIIFEGRWGQSIRFGSTIDERRKYPQSPAWKKGLGETGNPILIISNGTNPKNKPFNEFILENIDEDDASIWMTSGQQVKFTEASKVVASIQSKKIDLYKKNDYKGNQVIVSSDRIIFNAKKQELIGFSKEGVGFSSEKGISLDAGQVVEMESKKISLGINAISPALLGDRTIEWLSDLCNVFAKVLDAIAAQTHPTGTGPSGVPINVGQFYTAKSNILQLQSSLDDLASKLVFLNKSPGGPSESDVTDAKQKTSPTYIKSGQFVDEGDQPKSVLDSINKELGPSSDDIILTAMDIEKVDGIKIDMISLYDGSKDLDFGLGDLTGDDGNDDTGEEVPDGGPV